MLGHREIIPQSIDEEKGMRMRIPEHFKGILGAFIQNNLYDKLMLYIVKWRAFDA